MTLDIGCVKKQTNKLTFIRQVFGDVSLMLLDVVATNGIHDPHVLNRHWLCNSVSETVQTGLTERPVSGHPHVLLIHDFKSESLCNRLELIRKQTPYSK